MEWEEEEREREGVGEREGKGCGPLTLSPGSASWYKVSFSQILQLISKML